MHNYEDMVRAVADSCGSKLWKIPDKGENVTDNMDEEYIDLKITPVDSEDGCPEMTGNGFREKINEYSRWSSKEWIIKGDCDARSVDLSQTTCKITLTDPQYLFYEEADCTRIVLLPDMNGESFKIGDEYVIFTEQYKEYGYLVASCRVEEYHKYIPYLGDMNIFDRCAQIIMASDDPEGFKLVNSIGKTVRRKAWNEEWHTYRLKILNRAEELRKRIPADRDDLSLTLETSVKKFKFSHGRDCNLFLKMKVIAEMLASEPLSEPVTEEYIAEHIKEAKVTKINHNRNCAPGRLPNILLVGNDYGKVVRRLPGPGQSFFDISLGGVDCGFAIHGEEICYRGARPGKISSMIASTGNIPSYIIFSDADLIISSFKSGNSILKLIQLLKSHRYFEQYLDDMEIALDHTQFFCQLSRLEDCPPLLLHEMDMIVEL